MFPYGVFLLFAVHETFAKVPLSQETFRVPKNSWLRGFITITTKRTKHLEQTFPSRTRTTTLKIFEKCSADTFFLRH